jgi:hypothetical protein
MGAPALSQMHTVTGVATNGLQSIV